MDAADWLCPNHREIDQWARLEAKSPTLEQELRSRNQSARKPKTTSLRALLPALLKALAWLFKFYPHD